MKKDKVIEMADACCRSYVEGKELFGSDFFKKYMQALDDKIVTLENVFDKL